MADATNHPWKRQSHYMAEHIMLAEVQLGRRLHADEVVHHKDNNPSNNDLDNLVVSSRSEHSSHHAILNAPNRRRVAGRFAPWDA